MEIVKPTKLAAIADPVVSSPAANVMLLAPTPSTAFEIVQTIRSDPDVMAQGDERVAVPPEDGTSTPTGFGLAVKYSDGKAIVTVPPIGRPVKEVNEKVTTDVVAFIMKRSFAFITILTD